MLQTFGGIKILLYLCRAIEDRVSQRVLEFIVIKSLIESLAQLV